MSHSELCVSPVADATSEVGLLWKSAVERYEHATGIQIDQLARANNVPTILSVIDNKEKAFSSHRHDGSKFDRFRTLVSQSLEPIQCVGSILTQATKTMYPPSEAIFAAVRYLISISKNVSSDYDKIAGFFEDLRSYLCRLQIWENNIPPLPELQLVLTEVLMSVLVLCGICTKYIQTKRVVKAFRALVSGEDAELKAAYENFHKMVEREGGVVRNAILSGVEQTKRETQAVQSVVKDNLAIAKRIESNVKSVLDESDRMQQYLKSQESVQERKAILTWISTLDFRDKQRSTFLKHHQGTGKWLLDSEAFKQWFKGPKNSTLWCPGIPGSGKTVMMSTIVSYIEDNTENSNSAMAYVYCDYKNRKTLSGTEVWSSVLRQLVELCYPIPPEVKALRDKYLEKRTFPNDEERISLIATVSRLFQTTYVLIDALDECSEENREAITLLATKLEHSVRLFITSRSNLDLVESFPNLARINVLADKFDITSFLDSVMSTNKRMRSFTSKDPCLKEDIISKLLEKADGMFLLAHLQIEHLCKQSSPKKVRASLNALAGDVNLFYEKALQRIEDQSADDKDLAKRALAYLFYARRPLRLEELLHALSLESGDTDIDETAFTETHILLSVTAGLIRIDESNGDTGLVHLTLHEFFQKDQGNFLEPESGIAETCLSYLSFESFEVGPCTSEEDLDRRLSQYAFLEYASRHWGYHVEASQGCQEMDMTIVFLKAKEKLASSVQVLYMPRYRMDGWYSRFPKNFTLIHSLAYWGLDKLLVFSCESSMVNNRDSYGTTALHLASQRGHVRTVQVLLENGADLDITNDRGETALAWAARNGHRKIVELLMMNGADLLLEDKEGWSALHWAIIGGYNDVVKLLLGHYANLNSSNIQHNRGLILAAEAGSGKTAQMLLDDGAEVDWKDVEGSTALHWAVAEGHEETVTTLLNNGADVNSTDNFDNTPLHWAIPYNTITRLLLEKGALPNSGNNTNQTPLHWSAQAGQEEVTATLLEHGANANAVDVYGITALHAAALQGHEAIVHLLLDHGADPGIVDEDQWTPLHAAMVKSRGGIICLLTSIIDNGPSIVDQMRSSLSDENHRALLEEMAEKKAGGSTVVSGLRSAVNSGYQERILTLLENGVDINAEDHIGGSTALTLASWLGRENIVQLLLEHGADVNRRERNGRTAMHIAAENGYPDIIIILVENGADIDIRLHGWTPLLIAAREWHYWIVDYLVENGADVNAEDYHGRRALHWAAKHGGVTLAQFLLEYGADVNAKDHWGKTAYTWAVDNRQKAVVKLLRQHRNKVTS